MKKIGHGSFPGTSAHASKTKQICPFQTWTGRYECRPMQFTEIHRSFSDRIQNSSYTLPLNPNPNPTVPVYGAPAPVHEESIAQLINITWQVLAVPSGNEHFPNSFPLKLPNFRQFYPKLIILIIFGGWHSNSTRPKKIKPTQRVLPIEYNAGGFILARVRLAFITGNLPKICKTTPTSIQQQKLL